MFCQRPRCPDRRDCADPPDHTALPHRPPGARALARFGETATHLANGHTVPTHPVEDLADDPGFLREDLIARLAPSGMLVDIAVAIRRPAQDIDLAGPCGMQLAPPMPFENLGPLILGHHPLDLEQQIVLRATPQFAIQEHDLDPGAVEFIDQQDLVGILAG